MIIECALTDWFLIEHCLFEQIESSQGIEALAQMAAACQELSTTELRPIYVTLLRGQPLYSSRATSMRFSLYMPICRDVGVRHCSTA